MNTFKWQHMFSQNSPFFYPRGGIFVYMQGHMVDLLDDNHGYFQLKCNKPLQIFLKNILYIHYFYYS